MALLPSEVQRIRYELGYNTLGVGAEPYIAYVAIFDQVIAKYLNAGATTTSSTTVAPVGASEPVTLDLADAAGFAAGAQVVVDVDARQETATVQSLSGSSITLLLSKPHAGTYPVTVDGGETIVRELLRALHSVAAELSGAASSAGIKRVDVIEFFGPEAGGKSRAQSLHELRMRYRDELASALGVPNGWRLRGGAMASTALY